MKASRKAVAFVFVWLIDGWMREFESVGPRISFDRVVLIILRRCYFCYSRRTVVGATVPVPVVMSGSLHLRLFSREISVVGKG